MRKAPNSIKVESKNLKMNPLKLKQRVDTLSKVNQMRGGCDTQFLKKFSDDEINCICEACYNILDGNIPMNKNNKLKLKNKLIPIKNEIRKLGNSKISVKTKRKLLAIPQVGRGIVSAMATLVLPALISMLSQKRK